MKDGMSSKDVSAVEGETQPADAGHAAVPATGAVGASSGGVRVDATLPARALDAEADTEGERLSVRGTRPPRGAAREGATGASNERGVQSGTHGAVPVADYGDLIGVDPAHYIVGEEIARGGMGRVKG